VGKTLTAELLAEHLRRVLMPVSAGELGTTAEADEERLPRIFKRAARWRRSSSIIVPKEFKFAEVYSLSSGKMVGSDPS
jgi:hypothetical protein